MNTHTLEKFAKDKSFNLNLAIKYFKLSSKGNTIFFPVFDYNDKKLYTKYRNLPEHIKNPKGSHKAFYGLHILKKAKPKYLIFTEGETDTLALFSILYEKKLLKTFIPLTSTTGVNSYSISDIEIAFAFSSKVYIFFDNDNAGNKAILRLLSDIFFYKKEYLEKIYIVRQDKANDISDLAAVDKDFVIDAILNAKKAIVYESSIQNFLNKYGNNFYQIQNTNKEKKYTSLRLKEKIQAAKDVPFDRIIQFKGKSALCPFHNDKVPSLKYWQKHNVAVCFACGKGFDTIEFVRKKYDLSFYESIDYLLNL